MRALILALMGVLGLTFWSSADAAAYTREGFRLPADQRPSLLVVFVDLHDYAYDNNGQQVRNPEWEHGAENNLVHFLSDSALTTVFDVHFETAETTEADAQYRELLNRFNEVTTDLIFQVPPGTFSMSQPENNPDPPHIRALQAQHGRYAYAFNADFLAAHVQSAPSTDYVLFIQMEDGHRSAGQFAADLAAATMNGIGRSPGDQRGWMRQTPHVGNFMLVDRRNGSVEWFFGDGRLEGDERTPEGARRKLQGMVTNLVRLRAS